MKNKISFALTVFITVMLVLIWKIVLWDFIPKTKSTKEMIMALLGLAVITIPFLLHTWSNAVDCRIQHHRGRMDFYKKKGNAEQFGAHRDDLQPLIRWKKVTVVMTLIVILSMIAYRYLV